MPGTPPLLFANEVDRRVLARSAQRGRLVRLAAGIYSSELHLEPEQVVRRRLWQIVAHEIPGAVIADRSAREGGTARDGRLYVIAGRNRPLRLPGTTVLARQGLGPQPGDMVLPDGLHLTGEARTLLDNLAPTRPTSDGTSRTLTRVEVEQWLDSLAAARGQDGLHRLRDQARELAPALGRDREFALLDRLMSAALSTRPAGGIVSPALRARAAGRPYDPARLASFSRLARVIEDQAPDILPALPSDESRRQLLPFYEAYFSNFIEGTEFTLDEAAAIVFDRAVPDQRPQDAHDVLGTYRLTSSLELHRTPADGDELVELLRSRHAVLLGGRPELTPGQFKKRANRSGSTEFVAPPEVEGTLREGFARGSGLTSAFARAVFLMFLVSEVHPFADGNGRIARVMMNAELVRAGEVRIVVPTVYRLNYLSALKAATQTGNDAALIATLSFARRWTGRVDWSSRRSADRDLLRTHALRDAREAEDGGFRLVLP
ncbi:MAG: Fic family protein [Actinobacteria bacterium]|nr:Fic family protein [Actinomycetota bacterium]